MEANDMKAMREALNVILGKFLGRGYGQTRAELDDNDKQIILAALAKPPRNCDVGTAEEQSDRMHRFCVKYGLYKGFSDNYKCDNCPLLDTLLNNKRCELAWAQMPYESKADDVKGVSDGGE